MLTLEQIANGIKKEMQRLDGFVDEIREIGDQAAKCEANYKTANAQARLTIRAGTLEKLTVEQVEATALIQCEEIYLQFLISQNRLVTTREALRATQARLDGWRTLATSFRSAGG